MIPENRENREVLHKRLEAGLCRADLINICQSCHFGKKSLPLMEKIYRENLKDCSASLYFQCGYQRTEKTAVLLTLGKLPDDRQDAYMSAGKLTEAYILECLASELLKKAYRKADEAIFRYCGRWCGRYEFPGAELPLAMTAQITRALGPAEITCNKACMLLPKKSVAYLAAMEKERPAAENIRNLCADCGNKGCANRIKETEPEKLNYGYRRIFGKAR